MDEVLSVALSIEGGPTESSTYGPHTFTVDYVEIRYRLDGDVWRARTVVLSGERKDTPVWDGSEYLGNLDAIPEWLAELAEEYRPT